MKEDNSDMGSNAMNFYPHTLRTTQSTFPMT